MKIFTFLKSNLYLYTCAFLSYWFIDLLSLITSWVGLNNSIAECIIYISNITRISVEVSPEIASVDFFVSAIFDLKSLLLSLLIFTLFALLNVLFPLTVVVFLITYRIIQSSEQALEDIFRLSKGQAYIYLTITSGYKVARKMQTKCKLWIAHAIVIANYHTLLFLTNTTLLISHNQGEKQVSGKLLGKNFLLGGGGVLHRLKILQNAKETLFGVTIEPYV